MMREIIPMTFNITSMTRKITLMYLGENAISYLLDETNNWNSIKESDPERKKKLDPYLYLGENAIS